MNDFIEVQIELKPFEAWSDVLSQELADLGFESFSQEEPILFAYCRKDKFDEAGMMHVLNNYQDYFTSKVNIVTIESKNWNVAWEANFQPVVISDKVYVRAPFHPSRPELPYEILLTPKMSFGTGHHATTSMMMEEMLKLDLKGRQVLDVGCGTAILSILAEKLGSAGIIAIDNDDWAVTNSIENAEINACHHITVEKAEINAIEQKIFNVILANINRNVIVEDISKYVKLLAADGSLLLSGFHLQDVPMLMGLAEELGMTKKTMLNQKEWCMLHLIRST